MTHRDDASDLLRPHGGYRHLRSFQVAQLVYDVSVRFCDRYVGKRSRTHDQMVQAARSGVQNIAEGSKASGTSKKSELKLTNVARASLEELRLDYEDFLRQRGLPLWPREDPRRQSLVDRRCRTAAEVAAWVREVHAAGRAGGGGGPSGPSGPGGPATRGFSSTGSTGSTESTARARAPAPRPSARAPTYPEIAANAALTLIAVAGALLGRQLAAQADAFEREGGFTERLHRVRSTRRR